MTTEIHAPISVGELYDKISILEIKLEKLADAAKLQNVRFELELLRKIAQDSGVDAAESMPEILAQLKDTNTAIWEVEDRIRDFERDGAFGDHFVAAARSIYRLNDARAAAKRELNERTSSAVVEEKSYTPYDVPAQ